MIDSRGPRVGQTIIAVALVVGFVFSAPVVIPIAMVVVGIGAIAGPANDPLSRLSTSLVERGFGHRPGTPRRPARLEDPQALRTSTVAEAITLGAATVFVVAGVNSLAWVFGLLVAVVAATMAITSVCLGCEVYERLRDRNR